MKPSDSAQDALSGTGGTRAGKAAPRPDPKYLTATPSCLALGDCGARGEGLAFKEGHKAQTALLCSRPGLPMASQLQLGNSTKQGSVGVASSLSVLTLQGRAGCLLDGIHFWFCLFHLVYLLSSCRWEPSSVQVPLAAHSHLHVISLVCCFPGQAILICMLFHFSIPLLMDTDVASHWDTCVFPRVAPERVVTSTSRLSHNDRVFTRVLSGIPHSAGSSSSCCPSNPASWLLGEQGPPTMDSEWVLVNSHM